jgi:hypothetical protein
VNDKACSATQTFSKLMDLTVYRLAFTVHGCS